MVAIESSFCTASSTHFIPTHAFRLSARTDEVGQQTQLMLDRLTGRLPKCIGYTWEGGMSVESAPIQLRDMYNNVLSIPLDLCATPEVMMSPSFIINARCPDAVCLAF